MSIEAYCTYITEREKPVRLETEYAASSTADESVTLSFGGVNTADDRFYIIVINSGTGAVTAKVDKSGTYAGPAAAAGTVAADSIYAIAIESAYCKNADGTVCVTVTPASGASLGTDKIRVCALYQGVQTL